VRLPLEVELYRNTKHSLLGKKLRKDVEEGDRVALWYRKAQILCEKEMIRISETARGGQIDASKLTEESTEFLQLYLHNQVRQTGATNSQHHRHPLLIPASYSLPR
jgi:hypothetical protein